MKDLTIDETIEVLTRHHENDCKGCPLDGECKDVDFEEMAINALKKLKEENELLGKCYRSIADDYLVLRQKMDDEPLVENLLFDAMTEDFNKFCNSADELIKNLKASKMQLREKTEDVQEVTHGYWVPSPDGISPITCSECNMPAPAIAGENEFGDFGFYRYQSDYCPSCGAKMDFGKDDKQKNKKGE